MGKISEFTQQDYQVIARNYADLKEAARKRCADVNEIEVVQKAFDFANQAHKGVRRRSGEPYILHPIAVAKIVVSNIGLGYKSIVAALLHDVVEDTDYTVDDIRNLFGDKVASLVDGLTKIKTVLDNEDKAQQKSIQAENFKRILLTLNDDVRVVLIKLADRLHNCRTIEYMPEHKRDKILSETMFIFIPLAHRLGLYEVKSEMENIWLRYKEPDAYNDISAKINRNITDKEKEINDFIIPIEAALNNAGFKFEIKKRVKSPYSIWHKMQTKGIDFDQIYDLYAVRIIFDSSNIYDARNVDSERDQCYHIFSIITGIYKYKADRVRDWVKYPKNNGYEALHCTLMSNTGIWIEVQIRSKRMNDIAEKGIAAHWAYKKDGFAQESENEMDKWIVKVKEILVNPDVNALDLLDLIHNDLMKSDIMVFTPKGDQKSIEKGATALDFAYLIHTQVGNKAIAAKVNLRLVPLSYVLRTGDQVEIITAEDEKPKQEWLGFLKTSKARKIVSDFFRTDKVVRKTPVSEIREKQQSSSSSSNGYHYVIASCCNPIPGDNIIGFVEPYGNVTVHKKTCSYANSLASKYGDRIIVPSWDRIVETNMSFPVRLLLKGYDRIGMINDITRYLSFVMNVNIRKMNIGSEAGVFEGFIDLCVHDRTDLNVITDKLMHIEGIESVVRSEIEK